MLRCVHSSNAGSQTLTCIFYASLPIQHNLRRIYTAGGLEYPQSFSVPSISSPKKKRDILPIPLHDTILGADCPLPTHPTCPYPAAFATLRALWSSTTLAQHDTRRWSSYLSEHSHHPRAISQPRLRLSNKGRSSYPTLCGHSGAVEPAMRRELQSQVPLPGLSRIR